MIEIKHHFNQEELDALREINKVAIVMTVRHHLSCMCWLCNLRLLTSIGSSQRDYITYTPASD